MKSKGAELIAQIDRYLEPYPKTKKVLRLILGISIIVAVLVINYWAMSDTNGVESPGSAREDGMHYY